jgi:hypothetical protein
LLGGGVLGGGGGAPRAGSSHGHIQATNRAVSSCEAQELAGWEGLAKSGC